MMLPVEVSVSLNLANRLLPIKPATKAMTNKLIITFFILSHLLSFHPINLLFLQASRVGPVTPKDFRVFVCLIVLVNPHPSPGKIADFSGNPVPEFTPLGQGIVALGLEFSSQ
jgi:hypothetical protein